MQQPQAFPPPVPGKQEMSAQPLLLCPQLSPSLMSLLW